MSNLVTFYHLGTIIIAKIKRACLCEWNVIGIFYYDRSKFFNNE